MKKLLLFVVIYLPIISSAQIWNVLFEHEFEPIYFLNEDLIKENNIYQIEGSISHKKKNDQIRETQLTKKYTFNSTGKITKIQETIPNGQLSDTTTTCFSYNEKQLVTAITTKNKFESSSKIYHYDDNNRLKRKEWKRLFGISTCNHDQLDLIDFVTYNYNIFPSQIKQTAINSENRPFEEIIFYKNEQELIIQQTTKNLRTSATKEIHIEYDDLGRIIQLKQNNNFSKNKIKILTIDYDESNNVSAILETINNLQTREFQFLYYEDTKLLSYLLIQDEITEFIQIFKVENLIHY